MNTCVSLVLLGNFRIRLLYLSNVSLFSFLGSMDPINIDERSSHQEES